MTLEQVRDVVATRSTGGAPSNVSVFAGRIADTGRDPVPLMADGRRDPAQSSRSAELIWASPRELLNIFQADAIGCHIITVTHDILKKLSLVGKNLDDYSLETVKMFYDDARAAGFSLNAGLDDVATGARHSAAEERNSLGPRLDSRQFV